MVRNVQQVQGECKKAKYDIEMRFMSVLCRRRPPSTPYPSIDEVYRVPLYYCQPSMPNEIKAPMMA